MLAIHEHTTIEEAGQDLLPFALDPMNWVHRLEKKASEEAGVPLSYQRQVGGVRISCSVQVSRKLEVDLHVSFRGAGLTPLKAADLLERLLETHLPLTPNSEWQVVTDEKRWVHFTRRYAATSLVA
jgi:hypothetical protein